MANPGTAWFSSSKWKNGVKCENSIMADTIEDVVSRVHGNVSSEEISKVWVGHTSDTERVVMTPTASLGMLRRQFQISYIMLDIILTFVLHETLI